MKMPQNETRAKVGGASASSFRDARSLPQRRRVSFVPDLLECAVETLQSDGFTVNAAPLPALGNGIVLTAWHPERKDGFLIETAELGHIVRLGSVYLDPNRDGRSSPRWLRDDHRNRVRAYAETVLAKRTAEVADAPPGNRNNTLSSAAYTLGRYLGWEAFDYDQAFAELYTAAVMTGLDHREATSTIKRGLERGAQNPRDDGELQDRTGSAGNPAVQHLNKLSRRMRQQR